VVALAVIVGGRNRDTFGHASVAQLTSALRAQGLTICRESTPDTRHRDGGSISTRVISLARPGGCSDAGDDATNLQVDAYDDQSHRDAAARSAEAIDRRRPIGTVWTWQRYTLYLQSDDASGDPGVRDDIARALDTLGAR
jgi:hypothetical protein